jgi:hypothetical protein
VLPHQVNDLISSDRLTWLLKPGRRATLRAVQSAETFRRSRHPPIKTEKSQRPYKADRLETVQYLIEELQLDPKMVDQIGFGKYHKDGVIHEKLLKSDPDWDFEDSSECSDEALELEH